MHAFNDRFKRILEFHTPSDCFLVDDKELTQKEEHYVSQVTKQVVVTDTV